MIHVRALSKTYRVHQRPPGLVAALRSLVHRRYEDVKAVDDLTFDIAEGERVGFLGPNGAGKTTTLKMLAGLLHPTAGTAEVAGFTPRERNIPFLKAITLVMGQKQQLLWDLPPAETFALNRAIYDIPRAQFEETMEELTRLLELGDLVNKPTRQLSLGERMKCELAAALLHRPKVLFLDEPTIGLDVGMQLTVRAFVKAYNERFGATVILTSHYMEDVLALCPRIVVIDKGRLVFDGALQELVRSVRPGKRVVLKLSRTVERRDVEALGEVIELEPGRVVLQVKAEALQESVGAAMSRLPVADLVVEDPPLEDVLRELFDRARAERPEARIR
jgi:ABC-2 type transport system ATP-binding protein